MSYRSLVLALSIAMTSGQTYAVAEEPAGRIPSDLRQAIIHEAYARLAERVVAGGDHIEFKLRRFKTLEPGEFHSVRWVEIVTMPGGNMIDMLRESSRLGERALGVAYRPSWQLGAPRYLEGPGGARLDELSVAQVLAETAEHRPSAATTEAITTYRVTVRYGQRARTYKAAVLWLAHDGERDATLFLVDHITQGVEEALREQLAPLEPAPTAALAEKTSLSCLESTNTLTQYQTASSTDWHGFPYYGRHSAGASVQYECRCNANCSQTCTPSWLWTECEDYPFPFPAEGGTSMCHKMESNSEIAVGASMDARQGGAGCSAGFACYMKRCLFCNCGIGVAVTIGGGAVPGSIQFSFASAATPDWNQAKWSFNLENCPACSETAYDPGTPMDPLYETPEPSYRPGTQSGGSNFGSVESTYCYMLGRNCHFTSDGRYQCEWYERVCY